MAMPCQPIFPFSPILLLLDFSIFPFSPKIQKNKASWSGVFNLNCHFLSSALEAATLVSSARHPVGGHAQLLPHLSASPLSPTSTPFSPSTTECGRTFNLISVTYNESHGQDSQLGDKLVWLSLKFHSGKTLANAYFRK